LSPQEVRAVLAGAQASVSLTQPPADVEQKTITTEGHTVSRTIVRPVGAKQALPVFMFFHGGGWVLGDFPTHERFVCDLGVDSGAVAIFVNYTPSPEARYPVAIKEAYAATKWVAAHGAEINVGGSRLAVAGNMAAVVSLMAKDRKGPALRAQVRFWPVTDAHFENTSCAQFGEGHFLTGAMMKWFWDNYTMSPQARQQISASKLLATTAQLTGLPPAIVQTAEFDVLRDEGEAYARKLEAAGVEVVSERYGGMIHDFGLLNAISQVPATRSALHQASEMLKQNLK
jgi:acetyl esterase